MPSCDKRPSFAVPSLPAIDENPSNAALQSQFDTRTDILSIHTGALQQIGEDLTSEECKTQSAGYFDDLDSYLNPLRSVATAMDACLAVLARTTHLGLSEADWQPVGTAVQSSSIEDFLPGLLLQRLEDLDRAVERITETRFDTETAGVQDQDTKAVIEDFRKAYSLLSSSYTTQAKWKVDGLRMPRHSTA